MKTTFLSLFFVTAPAVCCAQFVSYECNQYPEENGWTRSERLYRAERWLDETGWFVQYTAIIQDPYIQRDDWYRRSIAEFAGVPAFFVEWHMITDGDSAAIPSGAPAILTASGQLGIDYHFTISRDQARYFDPNLNPVLFDYAAGVPHTFRLEVRDKAYKIFIDGVQVAAGLETKSYPTSDSVIGFGARAPGNPDPGTTRWDYIRYGVIPDDAGAGDLNCDGTLNQFDIDPFIAALVSADGYGQQHPACNRLLADTNADGSVNQFDILPFVDLLMP